MCVYTCIINIDILTYTYMNMYIYEEDGGDRYYYYLWDTDSVTL